MRSRNSTLALLALLTALASAQTSVESNVPGAGFDEPQANSQQSAAPTIQVFSRETIVDVLVTDANGKPVHGLIKSDFTISEDNKPQPIRSFAEYSKDTPAPPARTLPPDTYSNRNALPASGPVQIIYITLPCPPIMRGRTESYIADYLRTMPTGTQVAIFGFRADLGLRLVQGFTTDGPRAAAAIDNLDLPVCKTPWADPIAAVDQIAAYVAGIHGRKNLIWVTSSPLAIMRDGGYSWSRGASDMTYIHRLMDTYDLFTREQIAIYPFDPRGVPADPQGRPIALNFNSLRVEDIATQTGGAAIYNTNDFKGAVAKIVDDTTHFYTLSYIPPRATDDGHYHAIKITVDRPGLHLVYRNGYNDEHPAPPDDVLKVHMNQASMGLGSLPSTQLTFDVQVMPGAPNAAKPANTAGTRHALPSAKAPITYNLLYMLDQSQIDFAATPDGLRNASLEFDLAAYDSYGKLITVRSQTLKLPLTFEEYQEFIQTPFKFFLPIDLPPGEITLRAGVFDGISNKSGTLEIPLTVPRK